MPEPLEVPEFDYRSEMDRMVLACQFILGCRASEASAHIDHVHAVAPIMDPTAYMRGMDNLKQQATVIRAIQAAQKVLKGDKELMAVYEAKLAAKG